MHMNSNLSTTPHKASRLKRWLGMFNLNDGRWGREPNNGAHSDGQNPQEDKPNQRPAAGGPPDLDELWRDFNRKLGGLFGNAGKGGGNNNGGNSPPSGDQPPSGGPDMKVAGVGVGLVLAVLFAIWMCTGFFIVQEGQQAVITQFGRYHSTVGAGFNWRLPYPFQRNELVFVTQIR